MKDYIIDKEGKTIKVSRSDFATSDNGAVIDISKTSWSVTVKAPPSKGQIDALTNSFGQRLEDLRKKATKADNGAKVETTEDAFMLRTDNEGISESEKNAAALKWFEWLDPFMKLNEAKAAEPEPAEPEPAEPKEPEPVEEPEVKEEPAPPNIEDEPQASPFVAPGKLFWELTDEEIDKLGRQTA